MAYTEDLVLSSTTWTLVATNPGPMRIRCNSNEGWRVFLVDGVNPPAEASDGECLYGREVWETGGLTGKVYLKGSIGAQFAIVYHA